MAGFTFSLPNGQPFEIKGPSGLNFEQAKAIFDKQAATGSLVGLKAGDVLSASTQAQAGLQNAQAAVGQALSGVTGALGAGIPGATGILGSVSKNLASVGGALGGSLAAGVPGLTGAIGPAVSNLQGSLSGAAGSISSLATTAIGTLNKAITSNPVTSPINTADFAKQIPALGSIGSMTLPDVTGVMAQAKNLVGQATDKLSNIKGAGSFGFDASQLESAGVLKPGTSALAAATGASLSDLFKSAASFTGKLGIKSGADLLANAPAQAQIQQTLMSKGVAALSAAGIPTGALSAQGLAGVALSAAKSIPNTESLLKGLPTSADVKATFNTMVRDGAYAVNLTKEKVPEVFKQQVIPTPVENNTNRETLTAATTRVLGNDKIPEPTYTRSSEFLGGEAARTAILAELEAAKNDLDTTFKQIQAAGEKLKVLENQQVISQQEFDAFRSEFNQLRELIIQKNTATLRPVLSKYDAAVSASPGPLGSDLIASGNVSAGVEANRLRGQFIKIVAELKELDRLRGVVANDIANRGKELKKRISTNVS